ncbi:MAG: efflux RND transporter permease subunit [Rhodospirillales bacterium]|nr:efflux RND transporter permease subunit [Rhodospirillales bacterium]
MVPLIDASLSHVRTVLSVLVLILISGTYAYLAIPKESDPDVNIPIVYVSMGIEGISPDDSERLLLRPVEQQLSTIEGVKEMRSTAYQGGGNVILEFTAGFDIDKALQDVREKMDDARPDLPDSMDSEPSVHEVNFSLFPVLVVTLSGDVPERTLLKLARDLQEEIEGISTVLEAPIAGNRDELLEIIVDPEQLESYRLDGPAIIEFFNRSNRLVAAGNLNTAEGSFAVKVPGLFESLLDVMNMPLQTSGDSAITVKDIAEIRRTFKDPENFARLNGERAIAIEVVKRSGENIIDTIEAVKTVVARESLNWPKSVQISFTQDRSSDIRNMLADLQNNMISAVLLVMIVIIAALGLRASGLVGVAIPGAFLSGILFLYISGLTVNIVVLFSLILSVGMLVDGAIVVTEYADRKMTEGLNRKDAYAEAAKRMAWPITASTATTLAAFAPLLFWPGMVGEFMKYMPITLLAVLGSSLAMALIFVPALGSLIGKPGAVDAKSLQNLRAAEDGNLDEITGFTGWYLRRLRTALRRPALVILAAFLMLAGTIAVYATYGKGVEFFPTIEPDAANILVHARGNLSIYEQDALIREVESRIKDVQGIENTYTRAGKAAQQGADLAADVIGQIQIEFTHWDTRKPANEILEEIRRRTANLSGIHVETQKQEAGPPGGKAVQIDVASRYPEKLDAMTDLVLGLLRQDPDFIDIEDSRPLPGIDWELQVDRVQAAKFGLDLSTIGQYVRLVTNGLIIGEYRPNDSDEEIDIVIRHDADTRNLDQLDRIRIQSGNGSVPISSFVGRIAQPAVGTIHRTDQRRVVTIKADLPPGLNINDKVTGLKNWLETHADQLDPAVEFNFKGEDEDQRESETFLVNAFGVALFIMAVILVTQFNSFYSALLILSAVIMSTIGVLLGLLLTGQPFGIVMSGVGVIALAGIIVNNNIVLIDTYDYIRKTCSGMDAVLRTGAQRLRPVLLTTITTILGLLPMVFQINIDFIGREVSIGAPSTQWWVQLSTAIAFGLTFSTILTLIITPCALMLRENFQVWRTTRREKKASVPDPDPVHD